MAVKAINNTAGPDGLVPTLLVYRAYLRISKLDPSAPSITERVAVIRKVMAKIVKLRAKQTVNNALYYYNGPNITLVHNLPLNSKVLMWRESSNQTGPYRLLAVEDETCYIQLPSKLINFRSTSIKPYFRSKNTYNIKLDELEVPAKLDKLEAPIPTLEVPQKPTKPAKPTIKYSRGRPRKNPITENYLTSAYISARQPPPIDILVLVQETPFTDL